MQILWQTIEHLPLHWRCYNDEDVVFSELTGDTHILSPLAAEILRNIAESPITEEALIHQIEQLSSDDPDELENAVKLGLVKLYDMGLVAKVEA